VAYLGDFCMCYILVESRGKLTVKTVVLIVKLVCLI
jgi:hypothetical protein